MRVCYRGSCLTLRARYAVTYAQPTTESNYAEYTCGQHLPRLVQLLDGGRGVTVTVIRKDKKL